MKRIHLVVLALILSTGLKAQMLALRTDATMDVAMVANLGLDVATGSKTSLNLSLFGTGRIYTMKAFIIGANPEFRYWFNGRTFTRWFLSVGAAGLHYDIHTTKHNYRGNAVGAGIGFGYDFRLSNHFTLDLHAGLGAYYYNHERTYKGDDLPEIPTNNQHGITLLPYNLGVSFIYIIR